MKLIIGWLQWAVGVTLLLACSVCCAQAFQQYQQSDKRFTGTYGGLGGFSSSEGYAGGGELAATFWQDYTAVRTSGLIYSTEAYDSQTSLFAGYGVTAMAYVGDRLKSYVGLGAFVGENLNCERYPENERRRTEGERRRCFDDSPYLFALFPEFGFALHLGPFQINPFVRVYYDTEKNWDRVTASYGALVHWQVY